MHYLTKLFFTWGKKSTKRFRQINGLGCPVPTNEISEKEAALGGALNKMYSFLPAQYYFVVRKTCPKSRFNLSGKKNFLNMQ